MRQTSEEEVRKENPPKLKVLVGMGVLGFCKLWSR
jgi:hypothetical protein